MVSHSRCLCCPEDRCGICIGPWPAGETAKAGRNFKRARLRKLGGVDARQHYLEQAGLAIVEEGEWNAVDDGEGETPCVTSALGPVRAMLLQPLCTPWSQARHRTNVNRSSVVPWRLPRRLWQKPWSSIDHRAL